MTDEELKLYVFHIDISVAMIQRLGGAPKIFQFLIYCNIM